MYNINQPDLLHNSTYFGEQYECHYDEFGLRYVLIFHYFSPYNVKSLIDPLIINSEPMSSL